MHWSRAPRRRQTRTPHQNRGSSMDQGRAGRRAAQRKTQQMPPQASGGGGSKWMRTRGVTNPRFQIQTRNGTVLAPARRNAFAGLGSGGSPPAFLDPSDTDSIDLLPNLTQSTGRKPPAASEDSSSAARPSASPTEPKAQLARSLDQPWVSVMWSTSRGPADTCITWVEAVHTGPTRVSKHSIQFPHPSPLIESCRVRRVQGHRRGQEGGGLLRGQGLRGAAAGVPAPAAPWVHHDRGRGAEVAPAPGQGAGRQGAVSWFAGGRRGCSSGRIGVEGRGAVPTH